MNNDLNYQHPGSSENELFKTPMVLIKYFLKFSATHFKVLTTAKLQETPKSP